MHILIVKLSSLGDVVHAMPAVQDLRAAFPEAQIDWVVEPAFAPLVRLCSGVQRVIPFDQRRWRRALTRPGTWRAWMGFWRALRAQAYDAVIDLQGLSKSALVARLARVSASGHRYAMANRTDGSSWEAPTRWVSDRPVSLAPHVHAVLRTRQLCALALGYALQPDWHYGLPAAHPAPSGEAVALLHGSSRADKLWPDADWLALGQRLVAQGHVLCLVHGNDAEEQRSLALAAQWRASGLPASAVDIWPRLGLDGVAQRLRGCMGAVGVDAGLSHLAVALDLVCVQIYRHPTAWRTGPDGKPYQCSVEGHASPSVDAVWRAWCTARTVRCR